MLRKRKKARIKLFVLGRYQKWTSGGNPILQNFHAGAEDQEKSVTQKKRKTRVILQPRVDQPNRKSNESQDLEDHTSATKKSHFVLSKGPRLSPVDHVSKVVRLNPHHPRLRTSSISFICCERRTHATIWEHRKASIPASSKRAIKLKRETCQPSSWNLGK